MKLYTEEQVIAGFMLFVGISEDNAKKVIELITPIELPSDEEIFVGIIEHCKIPHDRMYAEINAMIDGAKWYREQIKN